ncbi:hypothetical protein B0H34DRAFT_85145 [Crassisporium funariophilum]|nr:hypothetical protein B0H34DRAFT_85145 [Crassisporium funariophilum]
MFSGAQNTVVAGGTFTETIANNYSVKRNDEGLKKLYKKIAPGAFHNSGERFDPPKCHPDTRLAVLKAIMDWVETTYMTCFIMWLYGPAGAGKSAIAQTIAEQCHTLGILAGSFFFSRTAPGRNDSSQLMATLVYQLIMVEPRMRRHVEEALQHDPMVLDRSLEAQMIALIVKPLSKVFPKDQGPEQAPKARLIIIDGLDECQGHEAQRYILKVFHGFLKDLPIQLILLIVSRPEQHIRDSFNLQAISAVTTTIALDDTYEPDSDIKIFLDSKFDDIKSTHPYKSQIPSDWPPPTAIQQLVKKSSGQFIYASTVVKYVKSSRHRPTRRLDIIFGLSSRGRDIPFAEIDNLYTLIFDLVEDPEEVLRVLSFIILSLTTGSVSPEVRSDPQADLRLLYNLACILVGIIRHIISIFYKENGCRSNVVQVLDFARLSRLGSFGSRSAGEKAKSLCQCHA